MTLRRAFAATTALTVAVLVAGVGLAAASSRHPRQQRPLTLAGHTFTYTVDDVALPDGTTLSGLTLIHHYSADGKTLTFTRVTGPASGPACENETVHATRVGTGRYFVRWIEKSGTAISSVFDLRTGHTQQWWVLPASLTGAPGPVSVSPTGTLSPYHGAPPPACPNDGSGQ